MGTTWIIIANLRWPIGIGSSGLLDWAPPTVAVVRQKNLANQWFSSPAFLAERVALRASLAGASRLAPQRPARSADVIVKPLIFPAYFFPHYRALPNTAGAQPNEKS